MSQQPFYHKSMNSTTNVNNTGVIWLMLCLWETIHWFFCIMNKTDACLHLSLANECNAESHHTSIQSTVQKHHSSLSPYKDNGVYNTSWALQQVMLATHVLSCDPQHQGASHMCCEDWLLRHHTGTTHWYAWHLYLCTPHHTFQDADTSQFCSWGHPVLNKSQQC